MLFLTAALPLALSAVAEEPPANDRLSLPRRVYLAPDQVAAELERVKEGVLVQMPLAEFDKRVRDAVANAGASKSSPRLIQARYRATLYKTSALVGTGEWKTVNPTRGQALLPLSPINLALKQARFDEAGEAKRPALLADFDGRNPSLLLERSGEASIALDWSARADGRPDGLYFTLEFPPAPIAVLELELPSNYIVNTGAGAALSGPRPTADVNLRLWTINCSGKPGVNLWLRRGAEAFTTPPLAFVLQETTQKLTPGGMEAWYRFEIEAPRPGLRILEFECAPELRPCEAVGATAESLQFFPGEPNQPARLLVRLRDPLPVGTEAMTIRCLAPLRSAKAVMPGEARLVSWKSPALRLLHVAARENAPRQTGPAVLRGETLKVLIHPEVRLESWQPGSFRLVDTATTLEDELPLSFQTMTLLGGGVQPEGQAPARPSAQLLTGGVEFRARQAAWRDLSPEQTSLTLQIGYEVNIGQLFQLPVQLPPGWDIESVEITPAQAKLLRTWAVWPDYPEKGKSTLVVDLQRPLSPEDNRRERGTPAPVRPRGPVLTVRLHPAASAPIAERTLTFPDAIPLGARFREGSLGIEFNEQSYVPVIKASLPETEPDEEGPWGKQSPDFYFAYRGQPVTGTLLLRPRPPQVRAKCSSEFSLAPGRAAVETRLLLEAETGEVQTVDVAVSVESREPWEWHVEQGDNQVRKLERLEARDASALVALSNPWAMAALGGAWPHGERWRITLAKPLRHRAPLLLRATRKLDADANHWEVPLLAVLQASRMEGEATLHLAGGDRLQIDPLGLREAAASTSATRGRAGPWRTYRYGELPVSLTLRG